jgi:hypothetical protein
MEHRHSTSALLKPTAALHQCHKLLLHLPLRERSRAVHHAHAPLRTYVVAASACTRCLPVMLRTPAGQQEAQPDVVCCVQAYAPICRPITA